MNQNTILLIVKQKCILQADLENAFTLSSPFTTILRAKIVEHLEIHMECFLLREQSRMEIPTLE